MFLEVLIRQNNSYTYILMLTDSYEKNNHLLFVTGDYIIFGYKTFNCIIKIGFFF